MPIQYYCTGCRKKLSISRKKIGELVECPVCQHPTIIPTENQSDTQASDVSQIEFSHADEPPEIAFAPVFSSTDQVEDYQPAGKVKTESVDPFFQVSATADETESTAFSFRRNRDEEEEMDLTPMVDVTFLLLIFFMITASFTLEKVIPTPVPDPNEESASQPIPKEEDLLEKSIQIEITANNAIRLDDEELNDPLHLRDRLMASMKREQKAEALVKVADAAYQETVVYVLDTANEVGMQKIRLAAGTEN